MGYDGSGNYTRQRNFSADASAGIRILASAMDQEVDDVASAFNQVLLRDGRAAATGNIPMGGNRLINVGAPTAVNEYMRSRDFIENVPIFMQDTTTSADTVSVSASFFTSVSANQAPRDGTKVMVRMASHKSSAPVMRFSGHSANIHFPGGEAVDGLVSGAVYEMTYSSAEAVWETYSDRIIPRTAAEVAAGVTPTHFHFPELNAKRYGAVGDGVTNNNTALANWVLVGKQVTKPHMILPQGSYLTSSTLTLDLPDYSSVTFEGRIVCTGSGIVLGASGANYHGYTVIGLDISRSTYDNSAGTAGVLITNLANSYIHVKRCLGFNAGVYLLGTEANGGVSHNEIHLGFVVDNEINVFLDASGSGYCNENSFYGGNLAYTSSYLAAFGSYSGTFNIIEAHFAGSPLNNNRFYGVSLQASDNDTTAAQIAGQSTAFFGCRLESDESPSSDFKIVFTANSINCLVVGGAGLTLANITDSGTSNTYYTLDGAVVKNQAATGVGVITSQAVSPYGDGLTRVFEGKNTSGTAKFFATADGQIRGNRFLVPDAVTADEITASQNNYNPTGLSTAGTLRLHSDASRNITGLAGGEDGREIRIFNVGAQDIVLTNADAASSAAAQFIFGANITLNPNEGVVLWYDIVNTAWRAYGKHV